MAGHSPAAPPSHLKRGRPRAERHALHAAFIAALNTALATRTAVARAAAIDPASLARMRAGESFPLTTRMMDKLRRAAATVGYVGGPMFVDHP